MRGLLLLLCLIPCVAAGHPSHVTLMEIESDSGLLEVALQVHRKDLDRGLGSAASGEGMQEAIRALIMNDVLLKNKRGASLPFEWVGMEEKGFAIWVYFQWRPMEPIEHYTLTHQLLLEVEPNIVHTVNFKSKTTRKTLTFRRGETVHRLGTPGPPKRVESDP